MTNGTIVRERPEDGPVIDELVARSFGPERTRKTVYRLREGVPPVPELCFVVVGEDDAVHAAIRYWPVLIEATPAILLGPLAVQPEMRGQGMGRRLVQHSLDAARGHGHRICLVVGDPRYYRPYGFQLANPLGLILPGPVDPRRFQAAALVPGALQGVRGWVKRAAA
ncbi:Predicted N-acetyltransferase YhbS [Limimonas halophila]|uniref:Predicted N-acetyltransferase YhbS n=1 Tax=Limimonas halophila TaxID=1082479 RepID=A0A1G7LB22_9PROT|nr:N-acetyltransferase [Limimonas halophila]SDF46678.1 Predicted N-acetyltransferase YhbS [Limimonas halophila]